MPLLVLSDDMWEGFINNRTRNVGEARACKWTCLLVELTPFLTRNTNKGYFCEENNSDDMWNGFTNN